MTTKSPLHENREVTAFPAGARLIVGTAQIAAEYGSVHKVQPPSESEAIRMIRSGIFHCSAGIDTARAYPGSERVVGLALSDGWAARTKVTTKLDPLDDLQPDTPSAQVAEAVKKSIYSSLLELNGIIPRVLLHRAQHIRAWNSAVWECLLDLRDEGLVGSLGVSVQTPEEAQMALTFSDVGIIQLPFNILDYRWQNSGIIMELRQRKDIEIHVRSVFLQGILLRNSASWPVIKGVDASRIIEDINLLSIHLKRRSVKDLCIAYVRGHDWVTGCVIGMESMQQLTENIDLFGEPPLSSCEMQEVEAMLCGYSETLLNPALWPNNRISSSM